MDKQAIKDILKKKVGILYDIPADYIEDASIALEKAIVEEYEDPTPPPAEKSPVVTKAPEKPAPQKKDAPVEKEEKKLPEDALVNEKKLHTDALEDLGI